MTYDQVLGTLFERTALPPDKTLWRSMVPDAAFEPHEHHPFDWSVDDPITQGSPALAASQLRRKINCGLLNVANGEAEAHAHGCDPITASPDAAKFDVSGRPRWTLTMALAWVMWRSLAAVRAVDADWIAAHKMWCKWKSKSVVTESVRALFEEVLGSSPDPRVEEGWVLVPMALVPYAVLRELEAKGLNGLPFNLSLDAAMAEVWAALLEGRIKAEGLATRGWTKIASAEWNGLRIEFEDRTGTARVVGPNRTYNEVNLSSSSLLGVWPAYAGAAPDRKLMNGDLTDDEAKYALIPCVGELLKEQPKPTKDMIEGHLKANGWKFSEDCFSYDLWKRIKQAFPASKLGRPGPR